MQGGQTVAPTRRRCARADDDARSRSAERFVSFHVGCNDLQAPVAFAAAMSFMSAAQAGPLLDPSMYAAIAGTNNVHAASLAAATLAAGGSIAPPAALLAILVAFVVNMVVKLGIVAIAGGRRLLVVVAPPLIAMVIAAVSALVIIDRALP